MTVSDDAADRPCARSAAVAALTRWVAPDARQDRLRRDYLAHLARHPDALERSGPVDHLTASCVVLDQSLRATLLVLHGKARRWFQPGGHIEPDDRDLCSAAAREAVEETGLHDLRVLPDPVQLDRHELPSSFGRCRSHLDVRFVAVAAAHADPVVSSESLDLGWFPLVDVPAELVEMIRYARRAVSVSTSHRPR